MRDDEFEKYHPMPMVADDPYEREPWPPIGRKLCPDCTAPNKPPASEWHYVRGERIKNWCGTCNGQMHVHDWQYKGIMEMTNEDEAKQSKLSAAINDTVLDFARAHGVTIEVVLLALEDATGDASAVLKLVKP